MKAVRIKEAEIVNPLYSAEAHREARRTGQPYLTAKFITQPEGQLVEDRNCWMQCVLGNMAPADDECRKAVEAHLGSARRKQLIEKIKALRAADGVNRLPEPDRKWLDYMEKAYATELGIPAVVEES